jgi:hypothetical protein
MTAPPIRASGVARVANAIGVNWARRDNPMFEIRRPHKFCYARRRRLSASRSYTQSFAGVRAHCNQPARLTEFRPDDAGAQSC